MNQENQEIVRLVVTPVLPKTPLAPKTPRACQNHEKQLETEE
jgi:hypothetical protein